MKLKHYSSVVAVNMTTGKVKLASGAWVQWDEGILPSYGDETETCTEYPYYTTHLKGPKPTGKEYDRLVAADADEWARYSKTSDLIACICNGHDYHDGCTGRICQPNGVEQGCCMVNHRWSAAMREIDRRLPAQKE